VVADGRGGRVALADGTRATALTGIDDHSRCWVAARLMTRESSRGVCDGLGAALHGYGVPEAILTENGTVFTGRFNRPPTEVLVERICRETASGTCGLSRDRRPRTGNIERLHRAIRTELRTDPIFTSLSAAQAELDEWVADYNTRRPHPTPAPGAQHGHARRAVLASHRRTRPTSLDRATAVATVAGR
jgi:transposase InsO family protein